MRVLKIFGATAVIAVLAAACSSGSSDDLKTDAIDNYAAVVDEAYSISLASAQDLDSAIASFVANPSEATMSAAKQAWLDARDDFGVTEAFRFYGGPIDNEVDGVEGLINAWPLDEAYVDYVDGAPDAGIINNPDDYPAIDETVLLESNELGGETNISTGWHAIEFLLWGQDLDTQGPGARPASDYTDAPNADRRATYLTVASGLLVGHLQGLVDAWAPDADNYRASFVALETGVALGNILTGIGELTLGELAGERMTVAYEERSQEDEHSCFSDNTLADYQANIAGVEAVVSGSYGSVSGVGIAELVANSNEQVATELTDSVAASAAAAAAIPAPLDQHLVAGVPDSDPGRVAILTTIEALEDQAVAIAESADVLGLIVS